MVLVLNCHPFVSKKVINPSMEPVRCLISGNWILVFTTDHVTEIYQLIGGECRLQSSVQNSGRVEQAVLCTRGQYLATVEKSLSGMAISVSYSFDDSDGISKPGEHSLKVSTDVEPACIACCSLTGNLAIGGSECVQILKRGDKHGQGQSQGPSFELLMNIHLSYLDIRLMDLHDNFLAVSSGREAHVLYIPSMNERVSSSLPDQYRDAMESALLPSILSEEIYYHRRDEILEFLGPSCIAPRTAVLAQGGDQSGSASPERVLHLLYKILTDRQTDYHTVQIIPRYHAQGSSDCTPITVHCLVSNIKEGYLYQLYPSVQLQSHYQYTAPSSSVSVGDDFLFAATDQGLDTYSHRIHAAFIRELGTSGKACPSPTHDICLVSMKPFYGLKYLDSSQNKVLMMSKVMASADRGQESDSEDSWSIYLLECSTASDVFDDIIDFGLHSNQMNPELYLQGLLEGHLLLRSRVMQEVTSEAGDGNLMDRYRTSCKLLGEFYARESSSDNLLTLPYFEMARLSLDDIWRLCYVGKQDQEQRISKGLLHYFEFAVFSETMCRDISQECLSSVLDIFLVDEPVLCSEVIVAPHLQDKLDVDRADGVLKDLKKRLMRGENYHWSTLDFIAVINVYLRQGEMEQALATFDLIYEDELVGLCSEREDLVILKDKAQFTVVGGMMCRFPSAIVSILINLTENGRAKYLEICEIIERNSRDGRDPILVEYLEAVVSSTAETCRAFHTVALEKLIHLYVDSLLSDSSTPATAKKKTTVTKLQKNSSRPLWLNKLPPFEEGDVTICHQLPQPISMLGKNQDRSWRFNWGQLSPKLGPQDTESKCHCLDCHRTLVKLQELLSKQRHQTLNIGEVLEQCRRVPEEAGRLSLEVLALAISSLKEAFDIILAEDPSIAPKFCVSIAPLTDIDLWIHVTTSMHRMQGKSQGRQARVYQDGLKDILDHLAKNLSAGDFQRIMSETELDSESAKLFSARVQKEEKVRHLKEDIITSLSVLVKS